MAIPIIQSQEQGPNEKEILNHYRNSYHWLESVSMKFTIKFIPIGIPNKFTYEESCVFRYDHGRRRAEWLLKMHDLDERGKIDPNKTYTTYEIFDGNSALTYTDNYPLAGLVTAKEKYEQELKGFLESPSFGSPLWGRISGCAYKNIPELLEQSEDIHLRNEQEVVNGISCYVLEGTTKYGKVTAWISPEKDYNALKWTIEKKRGDLFNETLYDDKTWITVFDSVKLQKIKDIFVPKEGCLTYMHIPDDGKKPRIEYRISEITIEPDFKEMGAFKINLPEGIRVHISEFPNIRYVWKNGQVVPADDPDLRRNR